MPKNEQESPIDDERPVMAKYKRWFRANRSGPGWHPSSWQGWLIIAAIVAVIVTLVVLLRTGIL